MNRYIAASAALIAGLLSVSQANAQLAVAKVVASCGTVSPTLHAGQTYALTMDVTGTLCTVGGGGGGGGTSSNFGSAFPTPGTAAGFKDPSNNMAAGNVDAAGNLRDVPLSFHSSGVYVNVPSVTTSANHALTSFVGPNAVLKNYGTTQVAFHQAASSTTVTVATADGIIEPGGTWEIALGTGTNVAAASVVSGAISGTGALQIIDGTGLWSGSGGGGGSGGSGLSVTDQASFTAGTSPFTPVGGQFNSAAQTLTSGTSGMLALDNHRAANVDCVLADPLCTLLAASIPAGTNDIGGVHPAPYPLTAVPITASATGTTAATTATLTNVTSHTTYICGFSIRANATAAATGNATVTGTVSATMNFTQWTAPTASGLGVTEEIFSPCVPASAVSTSIAVVSAAPGTGGVISVTAWGYSL